MSGGTGERRTSTSGPSTSTAASWQSYASTSQLGRRPPSTSSMPASGSSSLARVASISSSHGGDQTTGLPSLEGESSSIQHGGMQFQQQQNEHENGSVSSSSSSGSTLAHASGGIGGSSSVSSNKSSRARVNMACVHCRQRKIRCDGQQPTCSTCNRLGRVCSYESISELENIMARERKKRSKEAKQARLRSLAGLGIPIPSDNMVMGEHSNQAYVYPYGSRQATVMSDGLSPVGPVRDSRLMRQDRRRPYKSVASQPQSPLYPPSEQGRGSSTQNVLSPGAGGWPAMTSNSGLGPQPGVRKRGFTMDSYISEPISSSTDYIGNNYSGINDPSLNVTSLSQPTTPEATYSMHASMLSRELSSQQRKSPTTEVRMRTTAYPTSTTLAGNILQGTIPYTHSNMDADASSSASSTSSMRAGAFVPGQEYGPQSPPTYSAHHSISSRSSADYTTTTTSASSVAPVGVHISNSPLAFHRSIATAYPELEEQLAIRRRSSFDVGDFWRRTSVADAAVANFFDRVIQAKGLRERSFESSMSPPSGRMFDSPSLPTASGPSTNMYAPTYSSLQEVMQNTVPLDTPYTTLTSKPGPLSFSHPFALATPGGEQPMLGIANRSASRQGDLHSFGANPAALQSFGPSTSTSSSYHSTLAPSSFHSSEVDDSATASFGTPAEHMSTEMTHSTSNQSLHSYHEQEEASIVPEHLHLGSLPSFQTHRQRNSPHEHHPNQSTPLSGGSEILSGEYPFASPHPRPTTTSGPSSAHSTHNDMNYFGPTSSSSSSTSPTRQQHHHHHHQHHQPQQAPSVSASMTELASEMYIMAPPSSTNTSTMTTTSSHLNPHLSPRSHFAQQQQQQHSQQQHFFRHEGMPGFSSRPSSTFSPPSIQEEEGEDEGYHTQLR